MAPTVEPATAPLTSPVREALARISADAFIQQAAWRLYTERPEVLTPGVRQALDAAAAKGEL